MSTKPAPIYYLEIVETLNRLMYLSTGHKLGQFETTYEPKHIEYTEKHRIEILKALTNNELRKLENDLDLVEESVKSCLDLIHREEVRRNHNKK